MFHQAFTTLFVVALSLFGVLVLVYVLWQVYRELAEDADR